MWSGVGDVNKANSVKVKAKVMHIKAKARDAQGLIHRGHDQCHAI